MAHTHKVSRISRDPWKLFKQIHVVLKLYMSCFANSSAKSTQSGFLQKTDEEDLTTEGVQKPDKNEEGGSNKWNYRYETYVQNSKNIVR